MKKLFIIFVTLFLSLSILYADDYQEPITLKTDITGVGSYKNFGLGLAPVSTTFEYYRTDLDWFELSKFKSQFYFNITYGFAETSDNNREWDTGQPAWALTVHDKNKISSKFSSGTYFRQYGAMELRFEQPFIDNPIEGSEQKYLFEFKFGLNMRYTNISERLSLGSDASPTFVDINGNPKGIYAEAGVDNPIIAWPWLNGNRKTLSNYMFASLYFYPYREVRESVQDGVYGYVTFEYGPKWLLNSISPKDYTSADYYRIYAYLEEKLDTELFVRSKKELQLTDAGLGEVYGPAAFQDTYSANQHLTNYGMAVTAGVFAQYFDRIMPSLPDRRGERQWQDFVASFPR